MRRNTVRRFAGPPPISVLAALDVRERVRPPRSYSAAAASRDSGTLPVPAPIGNPAAFATFEAATAAGLTTAARMRALAASDSALAPCASATVNALSTARVDVPVPAPAALVDFGLPLCSIPETPLAPSCAVLFLLAPLRLGDGCPPPPATSPLMPPPPPPPLIVVATSSAGVTAPLTTDRLVGAAAAPSVTSLPGMEPLGASSRDGFAWDGPRLGAPKSALVMRDADPVGLTRVAASSRCPAPASPKSGVTPSGPDPGDSTLGCL